jgi:hypothetical protein
MSNAIESGKRITEIADRLEKGAATKEITEEYTVKWAVSSRTIDRYIALAKDIIAGKLRKKEAWIEAIRAEAIETATEHLVSNLEIEARLCQIVTGTYETDKVVRGKNGEFIKVGCNPAPKDALKAAEMLLRIRNSQANKAERLAEEEKEKQFLEDLGDEIADEYLAMKAGLKNREEI